MNRKLHEFEIPQRKVFASQTDTSVEGYVLLDLVVGYQGLGGADDSVKHARFRTTT